MYKSNFEKDVADSLDIHKLDWEYEPFVIEYWEPVRNAVCGNCLKDSIFRKRMYVPDFVINGTHVIEAKGKFTSANRTKMLYLIENGDYDYRMLFMFDNWLTKRKKSRYSDWCKLHDIKYAVGKDIPLAWVEEFSK